MVKSNAQAATIPLPPNREELKIIPGHAPISKVEACDWQMHDSPGHFMMLHKSLLQVDHNYQRDKITSSRVLKIAADWWWMAFGVLLVARRQDGTYWVYDGQHRTLAANKRSDIGELPCFVFDVADLSEEAKAFVNSNTNRGPVNMIARFKADLTAKEEVSLGVQAMIAETGHRIAVSNTNRATVPFAGLLCREYANDRDLARRIWHLTLQIAADEHVNGSIYSVLCFLERYLKKHNYRSLTDPANSAPLLRAGQKEIISKMAQAAAYRRKGGDKIKADGVLQIINYRRRRNKIPEFTFEEA